MLSGQQKAEHYHSLPHYITLRLWLKETEDDVVEPVSKLRGG